MTFRGTSLSAWIIPLMYAGGAILFSFAAPRLGQNLWPNITSTVSVNAAIGMYSAVASGMLALTAIVFSLTFVMVQFSATAYSPRLVLWVARDPFTPHAMGVFTATFLYALASIAWVDRYGSGRVPLIGAVGVVSLLIVSIVMFIGLIQRVNRLRITEMLMFTSQQGREVIERLYPPIDTPSRCWAAPIQSPCSQTLFHHGLPRKVQSIDILALVRIASAAGGVIEMVSAVGDAVMESTPILRVHGCNNQISEKALMKTIQLGDERTFEQDPKYAIRLLVDIAIKALSAAINDPTTAVQTLDQIEDLLIRLGRRRLEIGIFRDGLGELRLLVIFPTWDDFLILALEEIRLYGATSVQVMRRMMALVMELLSSMPEERQPAVRRRLERLQSTIARTFRDPEDVLSASLEDRQGLGSSRLEHKT
jgi:uncharacterized membrane protein